MAFQVTPDARGKSKIADNYDKFCTHCNREGHDDNSCFQLHGFLEWWGDRPRGGCGPGRGGATAGRGAGCSGGRGRGTHNALVRANKAVAGTSSSGAKGGQYHAPPNSIEAAGISGLTPGQWQQILDALTVSKTKDRLHGLDDEEVDWSG
ncbi:uncharacterized protein LOC133798102 [Humulus lupulus]|uniref:uncharacterized protein LOC133798102 n=1 Tax=Humulus lupulus TaxID=3486 RepID=UPI002B40226F|nr:uncharacterized protein LOC133798102 [Humulus lupulus]